ncbi:AAA family ATPase [Streptomyces griseofuscus]|uniref:NACHT domain-containing protein n=1 Tax=Streptomyces griseofuscus TaxID=146922 RepID=UPI0033CE8105
MRLERCFRHVAFDYAIVDSECGPVMLRRSDSLPHEGMIQEKLDCRQTSDSLRVRKGCHAPSRCCQPGMASSDRLLAGVDLCQDDPMDYDLTRLGWREFEHLSQVLAKCVLGPGVSVFGDGKDGGREATFTGQVPYPSPSQPWDGYGVIQAKFKERAQGISSGTEWLERHIDSEFRAWLNPTSKRGETPDYLIFTTNVPLSPVPETGGIARVNRLISAYAEDAKIALKGWAVWHADEICRFLDIHEGVRRAFAHFITPGDVLSRLFSTISDADVETTELIRAHAGRELLSDQWVRLGQAGAQTEDQKTRLGPVAVDLRATLEHRATRPQIERAPIYQDEQGVYATRTAAYILERGDTVLKPSKTTATDSRNIVLIGGPGQGKSTLGQLICQSYRVALLDEEGEHLLTTEARTALHRLRHELSAIGLRPPHGRRWPIRVALNQYANAILGGDDISLLRFIANRVGHRSSEPVTSIHIKRWLRTWPCLLVLDGLDEVVSRQTREEVMSRISDFLLEARQIDADLFVVATTRPQGYGGEFHAGDYETLTLVPMRDSEALHYAGRLVAARHGDDPDMREIVLERLEAAISEDGTSHLMRSPLQVTIMSLLVERRARLPQNRYELFDAYYDTIYAREVDKPGPIGQLLADHRLHIDWLHQHVGLLLQARAAQSGQMDAVIAENELSERIRQRLYEETEDQSAAELLAGRLLNAATERLVLLVAPSVGHVGFEVRSLQEYMAARALISGPELEIIPRLEDLASSASWRNAWMLAAAGIFSNRPHLRGELINALRSLDSRNAVAMHLAPGAHLAIDLLDDDFTRLHPRFHNLLVDYGATLISHPPRVRLLPGIALSLSFAAQQNEQARLRLEHAVRDALSARDARFLTAVGVLHYIALGSGSMSAWARRLLGSTIRALQPEECAAVATLSSRYLSGDIAGLPDVDLEVDNESNLAEYLRPNVLAGPRVEALEYFLEALELHPVHQVRVAGVKLPMAEDAIPLDSGGAMSAVGDPYAIEACLNALTEQRITSWQITMVFTEFLDLLGHLSLLPSGDVEVRGIS